MAFRPSELNSICIFNRSLGSSGEDATLSERAEKILYFFPKTTALAAKVKLLETFESFLDLSQLVDLGEKDCIHSVSLGSIKYALLEIAPKTYICLGVNTGQQAPSASPSSNEASPSKTFVSASSAADESSFFSRFLSWGNEDPDKALGPASTQSMRSVLFQVAEALLLMRGSDFERLNDAKNHGEFIGKMRIFLSRQLPFLFEAVKFDTLGSTCSHILAKRGWMEHLVPSNETMLQCQSVFLEGLERTFPVDEDGETGGVVISRKLIILKDLKLVFSSLPLVQTCSILSLMRRVKDDDSDHTGFSPLMMRLQLDGLDKLPSINGSRMFTPRVYLPCVADDLNCSRELVRLAALRGKHNTLMCIFMHERVNEDEGYENKVSKVLQRARDTFQVALNRLGDALPPSSRDGPNRSFLYFNETTKLLSGNVTLVSQQQNLSRSLVHAMDSSRSLLHKPDEDSSLSLCIEGDKSVAAMRSGSRLLFRFGSINTTEPTAQLKSEVEEMNKLVADRFGNFVML